MGAKLEELKGALGEVSDLEEAARVLYWDMETYIPAGGFEGRGRVLATLQQRAHDLLVSDRVSSLIESAGNEVAGLDFDSDDASLVRVTRRDQERERKIPSELVGAIAEASTIAAPAWREARERNDFSLFAPHLQTTVDLSRRKADAIGYSDRAYDALLYTEPGMTTAELERIFAGLKQAIVPLVRRIAANADRVDASILHGAYDEARQLEFAKRVITEFGFDFERGRMDLSAHPFMMPVNHGDIRLTNRVNGEFLPMSLFGAMHESGHGMYGQGHSATLSRTPLWDGTSPGFHESQSRLYENLIGRSRAFWKYWFGPLQAVFPDRLGGSDVEAFYRAINKVEPSLIRVESDEVTYNLHILLRFELENELLDGNLAVAEVPTAWSAKMEDYLGVEPPNDTLGSLQDIHWSFPEFGGFPGYTLGNIIGAQLMVAIRNRIPDLDAQVEAGQFGALRAWLVENVQQHGRKFTPAELLLRATGQELDAAPWIAYVEAKFGEIYGLD